MGTNSDGILLHGVGNEPANSEVHVSLIYSDYYFLEALGRLQLGTLLCAMRLARSGPGAIGICLTGSATRVRPPLSPVRTCAPAVERGRF